MRPYARTFRCPNCNEMINEEAKQCRFCLVPIDPGIAELIAGRQQQVNQACSDASYLRGTAVSTFVFLALGTVFGWAYWASVITFCVGVFLLIRWQTKFSDLITNDPDYPAAKRSKNVAALMLLVALPVGIILSPFFRALF